MRCKRRARLKEGCVACLRYQACRRGEGIQSQHFTGKMTEVHPRKGLTTRTTPGSKDGGQIGGESKDCRREENPRSLDGPAARVNQNAVYGRRDTGEKTFEGFEYAVHRLPYAPSTAPAYSVPFRELSKPFLNWRRKDSKQYAVGSRPLALNSEKERMAKAVGGLAGFPVRISCLLPTAFLEPPRAGHEKRSSRSCRRALAA